MAILKVLEWPHKVLETKSEEVSEFNDELKQFVQNMHETMDDYNGIGLAANQVGEAKRVITIYIPHEDSEENPEKKEDWHNKRFTFINPQIVKKQGKISWQEGCLSFPGLFEFIDRSSEIWVKAQDENGDEFELHANGLMAVCIQHEIDHIDGVVFLNRMSRLKATMARKKLAKKSRDKF